MYTRSTHRSRSSCRRVPRLLAAGGLALVVAAVPAAAKVLAKVDGDEITEADVRAALADIGPTLPQMAPAARESYVLDYLIEVKLVAHKAAKDGVGDGEDFARRLAYYHDKLLMQVLLGRAAKRAATDDALKKTYDLAAQAQKPQEEMHARHILLPTQEAAEKALKRIEAGEDFAKVATELSKDPGGTGGDLGWFTKDRMVPEFAEAAFRMKAGELSQPVKTQFGWHIIKVEERRPQPFPAFDQVKDQIGRFVVQKAQGAFIQELRSEAKIERIDAGGRPVAAAPPAAAAPDAMATEQAPAIGKRHRIEASQRP